MHIQISGYNKELTYDGKTFSPAGIRFSSYADYVNKAIKTHTPFELVGARDGGWDGNMIYKMKNQVTGEVFECQGYHSLSHTIDIYLNKRV